MGEIHATCGHTVTEIPEPLLIKDWSEGKKAVSCIAPCPKCADYYNKKKLVLKDETEALEWLGVKNLAGDVFL